MKATRYWIAASVSFAISMVMSLLSWALMGTPVVTIFVALLLASVVTGWVLWVIGLINYLRRR